MQPLERPVGAHACARASAFSCVRVLLRVRARDVPDQFYTSFDALRQYSACARVLSASERGVESDTTSHTAFMIRERLANESSLLYPKYLASLYVLRATKC